MNILKVLTAARKTGNAGEDAAARYLKKKGYRILNRNFVERGHEIDIVARDGDEIVFVEVKTRSAESISEFEERPASAVTPEKQRSIIDTAIAYTVKLDGRPRMRFDVIEVILSNGKPQRIEHLVAAFNKNTAFRRQK